MEHVGGWEVRSTGNDVQHQMLQNAYGQFDRAPSPLLYSKLKAFSVQKNLGICASRINECITRNRTRTVGKKRLVTSPAVSIWVCVCECYSLLFWLHSSSHRRTVTGHRCCVTNGSFIDHYFLHSPIKLDIRYATENDLLLAIKYKYRLARFQ